MTNKFKNFFIKVSIFLIDALIVLASLIISLFLISKSLEFDQLFSTPLNLIIFIIFHLFIYFLTGAYSERYIKSRYLTYRALITLIPISLVFMSLIIFAEYPLAIKKTLIIYCFILSISFVISRLVTRNNLFREKENILLIGTKDLIIDIYDYLKKDHKKFKIVEKINDLESYKVRLKNESNELDQIVFDEVVYSNEIDPDIVYGFFYDSSSINTKSICDDISFYEKIFSRFPISSHSAKYLVNSVYPKVYSSFFFEKFKRFIDISFSLSGLILFFPLFLIVSMLVYISSPGPILFKQKRLGFKKKEFEIIKFRTLSHDRDNKNEPAIIVDNDSRITNIGKYLRKYHLDEIPQLWNVLSGNLSIIGPRPIRKIFEDQYEIEIPFYSLRYTAKPGLTGWAQLADIDHRKIEGPKLRLQYDLFYIKNRSILLELLILLKTVRYVLLGKGV